MRDEIQEIQLGKAVGELVTDKKTLLLPINSQLAKIKHRVKLINKTDSRKSPKQTHAHNGGRHLGTN